MSTTIKVPDNIVTCTLSDIKVGECFKLSKDDPCIYIRLESHESTKDEVLVVFDLYHNKNCLLSLTELKNEKDSKFDSPSHCYGPVTCIPLDMVINFSYKHEIKSVEE